MGRPRLIILIRHGESEGNCDKSVNRHTSNHRIKLTAKGEDQARDAGKRLADMVNKDDTLLFYTSPYQRTRQTTQLICEGIEEKNISYKVHEEPRLREQDFGNFQASASEMNKIWNDRSQYGHFFYRIPNGESAADVYDRCAGFNETLFRQFNSDKFPSVLVLVAHGIWIRVFLMKWYRWTYEKFESLRNLRHCEFIVMKRPEHTHKFELLNKMETWHELEAEERKQEIKSSVDDSEDECMPNPDEDCLVLKAVPEKSVTSLTQHEKDILKKYKAAQKFHKDE
ncbi:Phosphoglycerate mutase-like protein AT74H [Yarrowia sp. B02]|nr:Phosphoglycerate mutase-like protein AT74H [Yarrowia sp. B02]